jgi:DegV family protein with EDD domain
MRLTPENTAIVLDSTSDVGDPRERHPNWRMVPLYVHFGTTTYRDRVELTLDDFYARLTTTPEPPRTSQPSPGDFARAFDALSGYARIVAVVLSEKLSGTYSSAALAAAAAGDRVLLVDSATVSGGILLLAEALQRRLERGTTDDELREVAVRYAAEARYVFAVDTLEPLVRSGRLGKAAGLAATVASVKPILGLVGGEIVVVKRVRGRARCLAELERMFAAGSADVSGLSVWIGHARAEAEAEPLRASLVRLRPHAAVEPLASLGPSITTHAGRGTIALGWYADDL